MTKRSRGAMFPLLSGPATEGLSLRDQIYKTCLAAIVAGRLADGARLPSARQLALDWRISRNTVDDAIARLQAEGFLVRRIGAGTFVTSRARIAPSVRVQRRRPSMLGRKALADVSTWGRSATSSYSPGSVRRRCRFWRECRRSTRSRWCSGGGWSRGAFALVAASCSGISLRSDTHPCGRRRRGTWSRPEASNAILGRS
jgi:DNA-binding transcriptional regulator YhcF (GntR family)